jgi:FkbM family methyltransferase
MFKPNPDQVFVDIGSNRGEAILSMLITSKCTNNIIGFEPNPLIFNKLKNYFKRNPRVLVHNFGLGDADQDLTLYVPFYRQWMFDGLSSFIYESAENWLKTRIWRFNEKKLSIRELPCSIRKLDDFNLNPYFVKIDVQGFEFEVIKGGINTIKSYAPIFLIESGTNEITEFFRQFGYENFYYHNGKLFKGEGDLNTFYMTPEKYSELMENNTN